MNTASGERKNVYIRLGDKLLYYSASRNNNNNNDKLRALETKASAMSCAPLSLHSLAHRIPLMARPNQFLARIDKAAIRHIE